MPSHELDNAAWLDEHEAAEAPYQRGTYAVPLLAAPSEPLTLAAVARRLAPALAAANRYDLGLSHHLGGPNGTEWYEAHAFTPTGRIRTLCGILTALTPAALLAASLDQLADLTDTGCGSL